jgi:hypothetical protein
MFFMLEARAIFRNSFCNLQTTIGSLQMSARTDLLPSRYAGFHFGFDCRRQVA